MDNVFDGNFNNDDASLFHWLWNEYFSIRKYVWITILQCHINDNCRLWRCFSEELFWTDFIYCRNRLRCNIGRTFPGCLVYFYEIRLELVISEYAHDENLVEERAPRNSWPKIHRHEENADFEQRMWKKKSASNIRKRFGVWRVKHWDSKKEQIVLHAKED